MAAPPLPIYATSNGEVTSGGLEIDQDSAEDAITPVSSAKKEESGPRKTSLSLPRQKEKSEPRKMSLCLPRQSRSTDDCLLNSSENLDSKQGMMNSQERAVLSLRLSPTVASRSYVIQQLNDLKQHLSVESDEDLSDSISNPPPSSSPSPPPLLPAKREYEALRASAPAKIKELREVIEKCKVVLSNLERRGSKREGGKEEEVESLVFCTQGMEGILRQGEQAEAEGKFSIVFKKDKAQLEEEIREKEKILAEVRLQEEAVMHQLADAQSKMSLLQQQQPKQQPELQQ